jgi:tetratricopeptide (TPR) repeat protein
LNGERLNEESWEVVRWQSKEPAAYLKALRQAEAASGLDPNNGMYLNTLGVAQYRAGSYQAAVATLTRSDQINSQAFGSSDPADLAFLAMAQFRLGEIRKARALMGRLTEAMKNAKWAQDPSAQEFQRETESIARDATKAPNHGAQ